MKILDQQKKAEEESKHEGESDNKIDLFSDKSGPGSSKNQTPSKQLPAKRPHGALEESIKKLNVVSKEEPDSVNPLDLVDPILERY
jgi:hypothetical protein